MNKEKVKIRIQVVFSKLQAAFKCVISKKHAKALELIVFGILQYVFLPVLCGFLTAGILAIAGLEKLGLARFGVANFPVIKVQTVTWSTYSGLMVSAGLGCILGLILSRTMKFGAKLGHFDFISPPESLDTMAPPSVGGFIKSIIRLAGVPGIVILGAVTSLKLVETEILPGVNIDTRLRLFEVTLTGVVIVATLGCLLMFLFDMLLSTLLRLAKRKEVEIKELR